MIAPARAGGYHIVALNVEAKSLIYIHTYSQSTGSPIRQDDKSNYYRHHLDLVVSICGSGHFRRPGGSIWTKMDTGLQLAARRRFRAWFVFLQRL